MTPPVIERWIEIIDTGRTDQLNELLAEDAVFYSPAVFTPQEGRAKWYGDRSAVLEFVPDIDGIHVNGVE